jgi:ribosomal protein L14
MFQKNSYTIPSDSSGVLLVRVIECRRCSTRRHAKTNKFLRVVIRNTKPELLKRRKKKVRAIVVRDTHQSYRSSGCYYLSCDNAVILLKKRMNTIGRELYGPSTSALKIKKFRVAFKFIF